MNDNDYKTALAAVIGSVTAIAIVLGMLVILFPK